MRKPIHADAELLLRLYEVRRDPELRRARAWFLTDFEPAGWPEVRARFLSHRDQDRWFRMTVAYWEMAATLVNRGVLHPDLFFDHSGEDIATWERFAGWIAAARADIWPTYLVQFERLVADHRAFRARANAALTTGPASKAGRRLLQSAADLGPRAARPPVLHRDPAMRKPTHADAELLLHLYEIRRDDELRRARAWFLTDFKPAGWAEIKARYLSHSDEDRYFRMTISYWELVGTLVNRGVLHPDLFFDHTGEDIVTWERCRAWIADARADIRPTYLYQFEKMVENHQAFRARANAAFTAARAGRPGRDANKRRGRAKRPRR